MPASRPPPVTTAPRPSIGSAGRGHQAGYRFADEARLRGAVDGDRELGPGLPPAALELGDGDEFGGRRDRAVDRTGGREADLVPAVVDAEGEAGRLHQAFAEAVGQRQ